WRNLANKDWILINAIAQWKDWPRRSSCFSITGSSCRRIDQISTALTMAPTNPMTMNILTGRGVSKADRKMVPMPANEQESKVDSVDEERLLKTSFAFAVR